jgi:hypothetical protein
MLRSKLGMILGGTVALAVGILGGRTLLAGWAAPAPAPTTSEAIRVVLSSPSPAMEDATAPITTAAPKVTPAAPPAPKIVEAPPTPKTAPAAKPAPTEKKGGKTRTRTAGEPKYDWSSVSRELSKYGFE